MAVSQFRRKVREAKALARMRSDEAILPVLPAEDEEFWKAVRALPKRQAQVIALHYLEDRSVVDIAEILKCAEGTVEVHLFKGRRSLATRLGLEIGEASRRPSMHEPAALRKLSPNPSSPGHRSFPSTPWRGATGGASLPAPSQPALSSSPSCLSAHCRGVDPAPEVTDIEPEPVVEEVVPVVPEPSKPAPVDRGDSAPATTLPPSGNPVVPPVMFDPGDVAPPTTIEEDTTPPDLTITSPQDGEHVTEKMVKFTGTTEPGATVAAGRYAADVGAAGNWSIVLVLSPGANGARFSATDAAGNTASAWITVHYDVPPPPPPTEDDGGDKEPKPPKVEFTAHAKYGSCDSSPPFDVYWGTAKPGSTVSVISEYGSGSVRANDEGGWEVEVYFPEAPKRKVFVVKVKDEFGHKKTFEFVSHAKA